MLTPKNDKRDKGIMEAHPKVFASTRLQFTVQDGNNDNAFAYRFKLREKGKSRRLMQRLRENVFRLPSPPLFRR